MDLEADLSAKEEVNGKVWSLDEACKSWQNDSN